MSWLPVASLMTASHVLLQTNTISAPFSTQNAVREAEITKKNSKNNAFSHRHQWISEVDWTTFSWGELQTASLRTNHKQEKTKPANHAQCFNASTRKPFCCLYENLWQHKKTIQSARFSGSFVLITSKDLYQLHLYQTSPLLVVLFVLCCFEY